METVSKMLGYNKLLTTTQSLRYTSTAENQ